MVSIWTDADRPSVVDQNIDGTELLLDFSDGSFCLLAHA